MASCALHRAKLTIVLVARSDGHVVEAIICNACHPNFHGSAPWMHIILLLDALIDDTLIGHLMMLLMMILTVFLVTYARFHRFFWPNISVIPRLLQLH